MLWIKEVEMVDSEDDLKSSHSIQKYTHFPNFEMLDARIAMGVNVFPSSGQKVHQFFIL